MERCPGRGTPSTKARTDLDKPCWWPSLLPKSPKPLPPLDCALSTCTPGILGTNGLKHISGACTVSSLHRLLMGLLVFIFHQCVGRRGIRRSVQMELSPVDWDVCMHEGASPWGCEPEQDWEKWSRDLRTTVSRAPCLTRNSKESEFSCESWPLGAYAGEMIQPLLLSGFLEMVGQRPWQARW